MGEFQRGLMVGGPLAGQILPIFGPHQSVIDMEKKQVLGKYLVVGLAQAEGIARPIPCLRYFDRQELAELEQAHGRKI